MDDETTCLIKIKAHRSNGGSLSLCAHGNFDSAFGRVEIIDWLYRGDNGNKICENWGDVNDTVLKKSSR